MYLSLFIVSTKSKPQSDIMETASDFPLHGTYNNY